MKSHTILAASILTVALACAGQDPAGPEKAPEPAAAVAENKTEELDILDDYKRINGAEFPAPQTKFKKGSVSRRKVEAKWVKKTETGFELTLPKRAPVPTPTVYKNLLLVSGGFSSREYYCFDAKTGKPVWGIDLDDDGPTTCAVEDDIAVFNTESCTIFAVEAQTGKQLWSLWLGDPLLSTPSIANGIVFTSYPLRMVEHGAEGAKANGKAKRVEAPKGTVKMPESIPTVTHVLAALELKTGKFLWQRWLDSDVMSAPVATDGKVFISTLAGNVYSFNAADGEILTAKKARATSAPVVVGKDVFMTQRSDKGAEGAKEALSKAEVTMKSPSTKLSEKKADYLDEKVQSASGLTAKGKVLDAGNGFAGGAPASANSDAAKFNVGQTSVATLQSFQGSRALHYGAWTFNCLGDELVCTTAGSGARQWAIKLEGDLKNEGGFLAAPPAAAGGHIFLATLKGEVLEVIPEKGEIVRRYPLGHPTRWQPAIVDGLLYASTEDGKVICQDTGNAENTGWYTWGGDSARTGVKRMEAKK